MSKVIFNVNGVDVEMDSEEVSKGIEAGKVELKSDDLITYNKEGFEKFKTNLANEEYKNGKTKGVEMAIKEAREKHGLEFEGKTTDNLLDAFKNKVITEAKIEPNDKIKNLTSDLEELRSNYSELETGFNDYKQGIEAEKTQFKKDNTLLSFMPDNVMVDSDIALMALKTKLGVDVTFSETGQPLQTLNGQVVKDKSLEPMIMDKDFISNNLSQLGLLKTKEGGRGEGDEPGVGGDTSDYDKFVKRMADNNIPEGGQEFNEKMQAEISAGTLKI